MDCCTEIGSKRGWQCSLKSVGLYIGVEKQIKQFIKMLYLTKTLFWTLQKRVTKSLRNWSVEFLWLKSNSNTFADFYNWKATQVLSLILKSSCKFGKTLFSPENV